MPRSQGLTSAQPEPSSKNTLETQSHSRALAGTGKRRQKVGLFIRGSGCFFIKQLLNFLLILFCRSLALKPAVHEAHFARTVHYERSRHGVNVRFFDELVRGV